MTKLVFLSVLIVLVWCASGRAQSSTLYVPVLQGTDDGETGLAFSNAGLSPTTVTLTAHNYSGSLITGEGITNPQRLTLPAQGQIARSAREIFGRIGTQAGWVEVSTATAAVTGFFMLYDSALNYVDGAELKVAASGRLIYPKVNGTAKLTWVNTSTGRLMVRLKLYDNNGVVFQQLERLTEAGAGYSGTVTGLFPTAETFDGYAVVEAVGAIDAALTGFEMYSKGADRAMLDAVAESDLFTTGYLAHLAAGAGYYSKLGLVNPTGETQTVTIQAEALEQAGQPVAARTPKVVRNVPANGKLELAVDQLFGLPSDGLVSGYVKFTTNDDTTRGLAGYLEFGTTNDTLLSVIPAQRSGFTDLFFSHIAQGQGYYTGLAFLNPNPEAASLNLDVVDGAGRRIKSTALLLKPGERRARLVSEILGGLEQLGGYVHVTSTRPIFALELFGSTGLTFLANVASQGVALSRLPSGRIVEAAAGGNVVAGDGTYSITLPRMALSADTAIQLTPITNVGDLPAPSGTEQVLAAARAEPSGTQFRIPAKLRLPIGAQLAPDTEIKVWAYDEQRRQYLAPNSVAIVDESGRAAWTEVTHFSTIVLSLETTRLLTLLDANPATGAAGTIVRINGSGFSANPSENVVTFAAASGAVVQADVNEASENLLIVTVPDGAASGPLLVKVGARSSRSLHFTVSTAPARPQITELRPPSVSTGTSGLELAIYGVGFSDQSRVMYDATPLPATAVTYVDATELLVRLTAAHLQTRAHSIQVVMEEGSTGTLRLLVLNSAPRVAAITPSSGYAADVTEITVSGMDFSVSSRVSTNGTSLPSVFINGTTLRVSVPGLPAGDYPITVSNPTPGGGDSTGVTLSLLPPPGSILVISPNPASEQRRSPGERVNLVVEVRDSQGHIMTNAALRFLLQSGDGILDPVKAVTGPDGRAQTVVTVFFQDDVVIAVAGSVQSAAVRLLAVEPDRPSQPEPPVTGVQSIQLVDDSSAPIPEFVINKGNTLPIRLQVRDTSGAVRTDIPLSFASNDLSVATVDSAGRVTGKEAGFATLTVTGGGLLSAVPLTVVALTQGPSGLKPTDVAQDLAGRLYLANSLDHTILLAENLAASTSLYAGKATVSGFVNDLKLQSRFNSPSFITLDQSRTGLYVADGANHVIRRIPVANTALVETFAGTGISGNLDGPIAAATFTQPQGVALDGRGSLWVADSGSHTIRRINLLTGMVTTVAGSPGVEGSTDNPPRFKSPMGIAIEVESLTQQLQRPSGAPAPLLKVIVADNGNGLLRRITETAPNTYVVETVQTAISSNLTLASDKPKPFDPYASALTAPARFSSPIGVAVDSAGNIYVSEASAGQVKLVSALTGRVLPATQSNTFKNPHSLTIMKEGTVLITDEARAVTEIHYGLPRIDNLSPGRLSAAGGQAVTITGANFAPDTIVIFGSKLVSALVVENTRKLTFVTPALPAGLATLTVQHRGGLAQLGVMVGSTSIASLQPGFVGTVVGAGDYIGDGTPARSAPVSGPSAVAIDALGNLYVLDAGHHRIRRIDARTGIINTIAGNGSAIPTGDDGPALLAGMSPQSITIDPAGNIYTFDTYVIRRIDAITGVITKPYVLFPYIRSVAADIAGNLYYVDTADHSVYRLENGIPKRVAGVSSFSEQNYNPSSENGPATQALIVPKDIALDGAGNLYITDDHNARIYQVTFSASGGTIRTIRSPGHAVTFGGISVGAGGDIAVSIDCGFLVFRLDTASITSSSNGCGFNGLYGNGEDATYDNSIFNMAAGLTIDSAGRVYIADPLNNRVRVFSDRFVRTVSGAGGATQLFTENEADLEVHVPPRHIVVDGAGNVFFSSYKYSPESGTLKAITSNGDIVIAADNAGNFFTWSVDSVQIQRVALDGTVIGVGASSSPWLDVSTDAQGAFYWVGNTYFYPGVYRFNLSANPPSRATLCCDTFGSSPSDRLAIAVDPSGNVYIGDRQSNVIRKLINGNITTVAGTGTAGFSGDAGPPLAAKLTVEDLAVDNDGRIFVSGAGRIRMISNGIIQTVVGGGVSTAENVLGNTTLFSGSSIAVDASGNVYFGESTARGSTLPSKVRVLRRPPM